MNAPSASLKMTTNWEERDAKRKSHQRDCARLEDWANKNCMRFNKDNC